MEIPSALVGKSIPVHIWAEIIGLNWVKNNFKTRQKFGGRCDGGGGPGKRWKKRIRVDMTTMHCMYA